MTRLQMLKGLKLPEPRGTLAEQNRWYIERGLSMASPKTPAYPTPAYPTPAKKSEAK